MSLFRRKKTPAQAPADVADASNRDAADDSASPEGDASQAASGGAPATGPFDRSEVDELGQRLDLGSMWLPAVPGIQLRMELDKRTNKVTGVSVTLDGSSMQVQAFAAPKTTGIWDDIRSEIQQGIVASGGTADDVPGPLGRELMAQLPATSKTGKASVRPARFIGVDGSRWFLRGVITGKAAINEDAALPLEDFFSQIVVIRDGSPRPPRDLLTMTLPNQPKASALPDAPARQSFDPLTRGPEITEIR